MKSSAKILFVAIAALITSVAATAQTQINPKVGVNFSGVEAQLQDITAEARVGWNAGVDLRMGDKALYLQPGLHYYNFTARLVEGVEHPDDIAFSDETTIQALKAPLNIGLRLTGDNGLIGIQARGGVTPTYILGVDEKNGIDFNKEDLNSFTWGANVGVGVNFLFLTADLNYEVGLDDFFANAEGGNNVLSLSVGIKF